jgi:hypothetical protein
LFWAGLGTTVLAAEPPPARPVAELGTGDAIVLGLVE